MIVFKAYLKILKKNMFVILLYTSFLLLFAGIQSEQETTFTYRDSKPNILVVNKDKEEGLTKNLLSYLEKNTNIVSHSMEEEAILDALFYREVSLVVFIPENFREDFLQGKNPSIQVKATGDYHSSLAKLLLEKYIKTATLYLDAFQEEEQIIHHLEETFQTEVLVSITSKVDNEGLNKASFYYNFLNYSLLASCIYVVTLLLASFKEEALKKRMLVSSTSMNQVNHLLFLANGFFVFTIWLFYVLLSFVLFGKIMFTVHGVLFMINSFLFALSSLAISFLLSNLVNSKEAINGIVNVVALGSSFLCGAFVPLSYLPDFVLKISHVFPSYYYILTNELIKETGSLNVSTLKPILFNLFMLLVFLLFFIILNHFISKRKRKFG